jgi:peptidoglycan/xylan/chitin deacetylase (PgdA/CDA1 family)
MSTLDLLVDLVPLRLLAEAAPRDVTAVFYHTLAGPPMPHVTPLYAIKTPEDFERDLIYLKRNFTLVSHDDIVAHRAGTRSLPERAAVISFDDGFAECFTLARPLLARHGVSATFFVCNSFIDNKALMYRNRVALCVSRLATASSAERRELTGALIQRFRIERRAPNAVRDWLFSREYSDSRQIDEACECLGISIENFLRDRQPYMTRGQIEQLHAEGFTIGGHTSDHPHLHRLADWAQVREQVRTSCDLVRSITGRRLVPFAFPFNGVQLPRRQLKALLSELDSIDLMYDTNNLMRDSDFIVNRIWSDTPRGASRSRSNLSTLIRMAYFLEPARVVKRGTRGNANRG